MSERQKMKRKTMETSRMSWDTYDQSCMPHQRSINMICPTGAEISHYHITALTPVACIGSRTSSASNGVYRNCLHESNDSVLSSPILSSRMILLAHHASSRWRLDTVLQRYISESSMTHTQSQRHYLWQVRPSRTVRRPVCGKA